MNYLPRLLAFSLALASIVGPLSAATVSAQSAPGSPAPAETPIAGGTLTGVARDPGSGLLSGVVLTLTGPVDRSTTTDSKGVYTFTGLPPGIYSVTAQKNGYQNANASDIAVISGSTTSADVSLVAITLSSLRTIGTVYANGARSTFNISGVSSTSLSAAQITSRNLPNLTDLMEELPGVTVFRDSGSRTPNTNIVIRGSEIETKTVIDGHALSSGVFGIYNTNYANPDIFNTVEVLKGAGLTGIYGGEAAVGVVNLQTRDFSATDSASFKAGYDSYQGQLYTGSFNYNFLNDRISVLGVRVYQGVNGPNLNASAYQLGAAPTTSYSQLGGAGGNYTGAGLIQWASNYAAPYSTQANLLKARVKITPDIWLTGEYLGLYGGYNPQGSSYGLYYGTFPVAACGNLSSKGAVTPVLAGQPGCTVASVYNAPYVSQAQIGQTAPFYGYFPNSTIANNEPTFSAELRAKVGDSTIFVRPYTAIIDRFINGNLENTQPGYGSPPSGAAAGWYQVITPADCQVKFSYSATGSSGPCFSGGNYSTPYVGNPTGQYPTVFKTSSAVPNCSPATPCWTTPTNQQNNGYFGYNTPFSQPEVDRERGATFSFLHPYKSSLFNLSFDYSKDDTIKFSGDTSPVAPGCYNVVGRNVPNTPTYTPPATPTDPTPTPTTNPYFQPNCQVNGMLYPYLPSNALQIPPTQNYHYDTSGSALIQATDQLQLGVALYYTFQRIDLQLTDPAAAAKAALLGLNGAEQADATLIGQTESHSSVNPHFQAQFRATPDLSIRATAGSSVTLPYNGLVSGFTSLSPNGGPDGKSDVLTAKNPNLAPETVVAYDLGFDYRTPDGTVFSSDVYDNTVHNVFVTETTVVPNLPGRDPSQTLLNATLNGPLERSYGLEATLQKAPPSGFGYLLTASLDRAYYDEFGLAFYESLNGSATAIVNGKQLDGTSSFTSQIPYFKAAGEINYRTLSGRSGFTVGDAFFGNNNATGGPPYFDAYGSIYTTVAHGLRLAISCQNLFNYNSGTYLANDYAFAGFNPVGVKLVNGNLVGTPAYSTPNGIVTVPPRTVYFTGEYRI